MAIVLPKSRLAALQTAIAAHLVTQTELDWSYYQDTHNPQDDPKGAVYVYKGIPTDVEAIDYYAETISMQLRLFVSGSVAITTDLLLKDWAEFITRNVMKSLQLSGLSGTHRGVDVTGQFSPRLSGRGQTFNISENQEGGAKGIWRAEYDFEDSVQTYF